ncbi:MAG: HAMP domain-containing histidine kinase [Verrucomicrobia bacterium]|jgi:signal transduction histidine kinase|nr:HAMP domain-containing histidine kinase [Verrucomicrobiota bacterium]MBT7065140.1 HAMP domain-containing histidine kinase [Verrucomicrobiota bacterium]MBT7701438.1 HAMP domain-containing histidine kinase [Verrucomicrobiota bacterium]
MGRSFKTWGVFLLFVAVVLGAMGWVSTTVLRLESEAADTQREAQTEEVIRLALWRIDSAALAMVIEESSRPYQDYWAFNDGNRPVNQFEQQGQQVAASPLLAADDGNVNVYFNGLVATGPAPQGLSSPQVPPETLQQWALSNFDVSNTLSEKTQNLKTLNTILQIEDLQQALVDSPDNAEPPEVTVAQSSKQQISVVNAREFSSRQSQTKQAQYRLKGQKQARYEAGNKPNVMPPAQSSSNSSRPDVPVTPAATATVTETVTETVEVQQDKVLDEGIMRSVWVNKLLILGRNVNLEHQHYVQGAWLNWENVKSELLSEVRDILPEADLLPVTASQEAPTSRMLAVLPARLVPGLPADLAMLPTPSLRLPLSLAWLGLLVSVAAVAALLFGAIRLSERRGAFVSAVTHELRTPLTTFKMYTEMLAEGVIRDPVKQQEYLDTLHGESNRLGHLVENVLAYARIERGTGSRVLEPLTAGTILERNRATLERRATEAGMTLIVEDGAAVEDVQVQSDLMAVGQILFNLVDNACKYAAQAADKRIHLSVAQDARYLILRVCDHGPGLKPSESRIVFKPFRKSAHQAARTAPGVGLGLALCKRLARQLGGDITYEAHPDYGACFTLLLAR